METDECDSCESVIVESGRFSRYDDRRHTFVIPTDGDVYETKEFVLCFECVRKIVDWIDDSPETETRVELLGIERASKGLSELAEDIDDVADRLDEMAQGE